MRSKWTGGTGSVVHFEHLTMGTGVTEPVVHFEHFDHGDRSNRVPGVQNSTHPFWSMTFAYWLVSVVAMIAYAFLASS